MNATQARYRVIRKHKDGKEETLFSGVTFEEATAHCARPDNRSPKAPCFDYYAEDN